MQFSRLKTLIIRARIAEYERDALESAPTCGLALTAVFPQSAVVQMVTVDGVPIGRVRRENPHDLPERWIAVPPIPWRPRRPYLTAQSAALALIALNATVERIRR